jgi:hypothetical protein
VLVFGSAPAGELEAIVESLSDAPIVDEQVGETPSTPG